MKDAVDHSLPEATSIKHELCSDNCGTCVDNRGCIYDQYLFAAILNMYGTSLTINPSSDVQQPVKEHSLLTNSAAA
jgi:hypothetical protein